MPALGAISMRSSILKIIYTVLNSIAAMPHNY